GRHLRLWAMDFPPLIALLARTGDTLLGDSIVAVRLVPAITHLLLIVCAGIAARQFGGGRFAQALAALAVAAAPLFQRAGNLYQPVILDQLWWTLALLALAKIGQSWENDGGAGDPVAWIALGVAAGLGLLTKFSIGFLAVGMFVALIISRHRRVLLTRWPWEALLLGLIIGSPSIVGQINLGFPVAAQMQTLQSTQLEHVGYLDFLAGQLLMLGPIILLVILGVLRLLVFPGARAFRVVAWSCLATFLLLMVLHGKPYYIGPIYPVLIGAGAAALELWTGAMAGRTAGRVTGNVVRGVVVALVLIFGVLTLPMGLPILAPPTMARYSTALGITEAVTTNDGKQLRIPQDYADMLGWPEQARAVASVFRTLPPEKQKQAVLMGANYGETGALELYGRRLRLPRAVSPAGSYWFFGPGTRPGAVLLTVGIDSADLAGYYRVVRPVARVRNPWGVPEERDVPVVIAEQPLRTLQQQWPSLKGRN
ncbi:MAG TPA: glycosyltransferase family 39 protein, partial [Longimicrobiales bacterium]